MKVSILSSWLAIVLGSYAADQKAAYVLNDALSKFKQINQEEALKAADCIKKAAPEFPNDSHFAGLHSQIATVFTALRKVDDAKAELVKTKQDLTVNLKTMGRAAPILKAANGKVEVAQQELQKSLAAAARFNREFYADGYEETATTFQGVLTRVATKAGVKWFPVELHSKPSAGASVVTIKIDSLNLKDAKLVAFSEGNVIIAHTKGVKAVSYERLTEDQRKLVGSTNPQLDLGALYEKYQEEKRWTEAGKGIQPIGETQYVVRTNARFVIPKQWKLAYGIQNRDFENEVTDDELMSFDFRQGGDFGLLTVTVVLTEKARVEHRKMVRLQIENGIRSSQPPSRITGRNGQIFEITETVKEQSHDILIVARNKLGEEIVELSAGFFNTANPSGHLKALKTAFVERFQFCSNDIDQCYQNELALLGREPKILPIEELVFVDRPLTAEALSQLGPGEKGETGAFGDLTALVFKRLPPQLNFLKEIKYEMDDAASVRVIVLTGFPSEEATLRFVGKLNGGTRWLEEGKHLFRNPTTGVLLRAPDEKVDAERAMFVSHKYLRRLTGTSGE